jgi:bacteriorhodopsin
MFQLFSGRSFLLIHASLGLVFFAYMSAVQVGSYVGLQAELGGRELLAEEQMQKIHEEQMKSASRLSLIFSSAFFFMLSVWLMAQQTEMNLGLVQRSALGKRLDFCCTLSLYICFFSALFNAIQLMDDDNLLLKNAEGEETVLDLGRPIEWMLTCPLMQLAVPILAGEKVPDSRRLSMPVAAFTVLACGLLSTIASNLLLKALMYAAGLLVFFVMLSLMNACIMEASSGGENLFQGSSFLRGLVTVITSTWFPFPIWYALSPEGFNVIRDEGAMKVAVAFLNVLSKGAFIMYLTRVRTDHSTRQKTLVSVGYLQEAKKSEFDDSINFGQSGQVDGKLDKITIMLIEEVLETMGRAKDKDHVIEKLQSQLITSSDDILSLTHQYCLEVDLPWGLVLALKSKIRSYHVELDDPWSMQAAGRKEEVEVSVAAPHIAKNQEKIRSVVRRQTLKDLPTMGFDAMSEKSGYPDSPRTTTPSSGPTRASLGSSYSFDMPTQSSLGSSMPDDTKALNRLMENHQKNMQGQVDECRQFVVQSMDKIMEALDQRLGDAKKSNAVTSGAA